MTADREALLAGRQPESRATWVFPVPLSPTAITFSRRVMYSQWASSAPSSAQRGIAVNSKLSRLLTVGNRASSMRRSTIRCPGPSPRARPSAADHQGRRCLRERTVGACRIRAGSSAAGVPSGDGRAAAGRVADDEAAVRRSSGLGRRHRHGSPRQVGVAVRSSRGGRRSIRHSTRSDRVKADHATGDGLSRRRPARPRGGAPPAAAAPDEAAFAAFGHRFDQVAERGEFLGQVPADEWGRWSRAPTCVEQSQ